jgi:hypothetical protein
MSDLPLQMSSAVPTLPAGWHVLNFKVLAGGRLAIVGANADLHAALRDDLAQKTVGEALRLASQATARVWTVQDDYLIEGAEFPLLEPFPIVDQFPDGRWLVANSRSNGSGNVRIFSKGCTEARRIELGDGIEHIKIDDQNRIWVGWFDEGIYGNDNWRLPGLKWAPSAYGIAAFDDHGALVKHAALEFSADCYALNVFGDGAWACTYPDFPIWQMSNDCERTWSTNLRGVRAIAVKYPHVLAAGGYEEDNNRVALLRLDEGAAHSIGEWRLPFAIGFRAEVSMIDGRDDELHVVEDQQWHRWRVTDFTGASGVR